MMRCFANDCLITVTTFSVGLKSLVKLLLGWKMQVRTETVTENRIGEVDTLSVVLTMVKPSWWLKRKHNNDAVAPLDLQ